MGLDINKIANQMHCTQKEALQRLKDDALLRAQYKVTEQQLKEFEQLNGGVNWGKTMDEYAFSSSKADQYKANLPKAQKENELAEARKRNEKKKEHELREERKQENRNTLAQVAKEVGKGLLALTPLGWVSCENDVNATQNQQVNVTIPNPKDYTDQIDAIIKRLDGIENNSTTQFKNLMSTLEMLINNNKANAENYNKAFEDIKALLEKVVKNGEDILTENGKNAEAILAQLALILAKDTDIESKLKEVINLLKDIKCIGNKILNAIKQAKDELIKTLNTNNKAVLDAIAKLDENDQKTLNILNDIKALIDQYGGRGNSLAEAILAAIGRIDINPNVDLSGIEALLKQLVNGQKQTNDEIAYLTNLFNDFSADTAAKLNTIISKLDKNSPDYSKQLQTIIDLLKKLDANNDVRNQKVLDAIDKLGVKVTNNLTAILNKIGKGGQEGKDYSSILNAILAKLDNMDKNNVNKFNQVLEALGKLSVGDKTDVNLQPILDKLDQILKAIKDHKVTVDVTGKVTCECNCGNKAVHEGVLGDLEGLLG